MKSNLTASTSAAASAASAAALVLALSAACGPVEPGNGTNPDLGSAVGFAILAKAGVSTVPTSAITGDIGVSPAAATFITGFSLSEDASNEFSTSPQVTGKVYAADYTPPTPDSMTTSVVVQRERDS